mmetsp:Transcript_70141/g.197923  ORF Transcript_70141/g.197923 Transcript_70141/m.197923 type:complete len:96 (-) Transcript_70141:329-616(-)
MGASPREVVEAGALVVMEVVVFVVVMDDSRSFHSPAHLEYSDVALRPAAGGVTAVELRVVVDVVPWHPRPVALQQWSFFIADHPSLQCSYPASQL